MALSKIQAESMNLADTFAFTGTVTGAGEAVEEGTWTPAMSSFNHTTQVGRYLKIGKIIVVHATIVGTSTRSGGGVTVSGLPYATNSTANFYQSAVIGGHSYVGFTSANMLGLTCRLDPNNTYFAFLRYRHNSNMDGLQATQQGTSTQTFYVGATYIAN